MPTTHRSELVTKIADALTDEAYDGGMGPMSETEFPRHVLRLAETAVEVVSAVAEEKPTEKEGDWAREYRQGRAEQVEQQRIANLIALAQLPNVGTARRNQAANAAADALLAGMPAVGEVTYV